MWFSFYCLFKIICYYLRYCIIIHFNYSFSLYYILFWLFLNHYYHHFSHSSSLYFDYSWIHGLWSVRFFLKGNVQKAKETQRLSSPKHKVVGLDLIPDSPVQPHLDRWTRSRKAIAMYLSCGILQVTIVILLCIFCFNYKLIHIGLLQYLCTTAYSYNHHSICKLQLQFEILPSVTDLKFLSLSQRGGPAGQVLVDTEITPERA